MATETRFFRNAQSEVNGLNCYELKTTQTETNTYVVVSRNSATCHMGIRVYKRTSGGSETEITSGTPVAQVDSTLGTGEKSNTWNCPETALNLTDSIVVETWMFDRYGVWQKKATFQTEQLGASKLNGATWTVVYYQQVVLYWYSFWFGDASYNSRITNFQYSSDLEPGTKIFTVDAILKGTAKAKTFGAHPVYKVEIYNASEELIHTIEDSVLGLHFKDVITDGVGLFSFLVPTKKNGGYIYNDIALNDTVKIFAGYKSVGVTPDFVGRVTMISAPLNLGYMRQIEGLGLGEILLRRFKKNKFYNGVGASTIVTEIATLLDLGTGEIEADTTPETHEVRTKRCFDLLAEVSDYWASGETQVKKDFKVDVAGNLVWKSRPIRAVGVETLEVGKNILDHKVIRDLDSVKNDIVVYGQAEAPYPRDKDEWTESADWNEYWTASVGTVERSSVGTVKVGTYKIVGDSGAGNQATFKLDIPRITIRDINTLYFWLWAASVPPHSGELRLFAPDSNNYFYTSLPVDGNWHWNEFSLGPKYEYDEATNPNGIWSLHNSPNWWDLEAIEFDFHWSATSQSAWIDGMYFYPERWSGTATDEASIYDQREAEFTYDKLHSDGECVKRAETLLYQLKDAPTQIELTLPGNMNVLAGDRLTITIPAENISSESFDVLSVEHFLNNENFLTKAIMVNSANIRAPIEANSARIIGNLTQKVRQLTMDMKLLK